MAILNTKPDKAMLKTILIQTALSILSGAVKNLIEKKPDSKIVRFLTNKKTVKTVNDLNECVKNLLNKNQG